MSNQVQNDSLSVVESSTERLTVYLSNQVQNDSLSVFESSTERLTVYLSNQVQKVLLSIVESSTKGLYLKEGDSEISSADIVDQAASQTEKTVEMRTLNRQIKLLSKIDKAVKKINNDTYGYCEETGEPIGLKRLIARPIATLSIEAQEKHEKNEKIFADS